MKKIIIALILVVGCFAVIKPDYHGTVGGSGSASWSKEIAVTNGVSDWLAIPDRPVSVSYQIMVASNTAYLMWTAATITRVTNGTAPATIANLGVVSTTNGEGFVSMPSAVRLHGLTNVARVTVFIVTM